MKWILYDIGGVLELVDDHRWPQTLEKSWSDRLGLSVQALRARGRGPSGTYAACSKGVADSESTLSR